MTSIAVIGLYIAYITPVFLRLRAGDSFQPGPWNLGRWSRPIGTVATIWVVFIAILFMLPQVTPINATTFNYAPVAVGVVLLFAGGWWVLSAKNWFKGPRSRARPEELAAIERDLELAAPEPEPAPRPERANARPPAGRSVPGLSRVRRRRSVEHRRPGREREVERRRRQRARRGRCR